MKNAINIFQKYLESENLKLTVQRETILNIFLKTEQHVSADEFYVIVSKKYPKIGHSTVFRTLKHIAKSSVAREVDLGDGIVRYEHRFGHEHHDHLICVKCAKYVEILSPKIEQLQKVLARRHNFKIINHKMELFGYCSKCKKKE